MSVHSERGAPAVATLCIDARLDPVVVPGRERMCFVQ